MSSTRNIISPGLWANDALTAVPATPTPGVSYRNIGAFDIEQGWPFGLKVDSAPFNQVVYQVTSLLSILDQRGVLGWTSLLNYTVGALVLGSDNVLYQCAVNNGPGSSVQDPVSTSGYWNALRPGSGDVGDIKAVAANTPPTGWLKCNGAAISRTAYPALFARIGTVWGAGNGSTTFNVPDLQGEFLRGWDENGAVDPGRGFASLQMGSNAAHTHTLYADNSGSGANGQVTSINGGNFPLAGSARSGGYLATNGAAVQLVGVDGGSEARPRNRAVLFVIRAS